MVNERDLIQDTAKCTALIDLAIKKLENPTIASKDRILGLLTGARNCTLAHLRMMQIEKGVESKDIISTFKKYGSQSTK